MREQNGSALSADPVIVSFFDRRAADYDREYEAQTPGGYALRIRRKKVLSLFDRPGGAVLDVGCGPGVMAGEMMARGCSFWGVDPSSNMISICRSRFAESERVHFLKGDALQLAVPSGFFDAVLCMGVIDSVKDGRGAIREMLRVLKPGGTLIVTFTNIYSPYAWWKNYVFYPLVAKWQNWRSKRSPHDIKPGRRNADTRVLYSRRASHGMLRAEGASVLQSVGYYYNVAISPLDEIFPSGSLWLTRKIEESAWSAPEWLAAGRIVKARKD
jgi:ubiquinone/menaquinone biosynthesis C-methylase UbiE